MSDICTWPYCGHTAKDQCKWEDQALRWQAHIEARSADPDEIITLRVENERLRAALLAELADHEEAIAHDAGGLEYASLVGIPLSNADSLAQSVRYHESRAKLIRAALEESKHE